VRPFAYIISETNKLFSIELYIEGLHLTLMDLFDSYSYLVTVRPLLPEAKVKGHVFSHKRLNRPRILLYGAEPFLRI